MCYIYIYLINLLCVIHIYIKLIRLHIYDIRKPDICFCICFGIPKSRFLSCYGIPQNFFRNSEHLSSQLVTKFRNPASSFVSEFLESFSGIFGTFVLTICSWISKICFGIPNICLLNFVRNSENPASLFL